MPANRSRTERWKHTLWSIYERGGGLEIAVARPASTPDQDPAEHAKDLVWRVRLLEVRDDDLLVELPGAMGRTFRIEPGTPLVGIMTVGQNRWMFHTHADAIEDFRTRQGTVPGMRLRMPDNVERCQRRSFDRISTASLALPSVECFPLLDPRTAAAAEIANRIEILDALDTDLTGTPPATHADNHAAPDMPRVGPAFPATLANIGGGGVGLIVDRNDRAALDTTRMFWLRADLRPIIPAPLALTARLAHAHVDSQLNTYAGLAFDFDFNPSHRAFVISQIERYLSELARRAA
jgi:hypothetical protein